MNKIRDLARKEFGNLSAFDWVFLCSMLVLQVIVFVACPDTWLNIVAGIAGVISVVLCARGKISFYFIGFVQTFSYLYLAWNARFYGEVIENLWYFVTMIWGIFVWKDNLSVDKDGGQQVESLKFTPKQWFWSVVGTIAATIIMGFFLERIGSAQAYTDAATNVMAIFAQILMVKRYREQWLWWFVIDIFCIKLWFVAGNWSMVAMYVAWTINCIYGWVNWTKEARKNGV